MKLIYLDKEIARIKTKCDGREGWIKDIAEAVGKQSDKLDKVATKSDQILGELRARR